MSLLMLYAYCLYINKPILKARLNFIACEKSDFRKLCYKRINKAKELYLEMTGNEDSYENEMLLPGFIVLIGYFKEERCLKWLLSVAKKYKMETLKEAINDKEKVLRARYDSKNTGSQQTAITNGFDPNINLKDNELQFTQQSNTLFNYFEKEKAYLPYKTNIGNALKRSKTIDRKKSFFNEFIRPNERAMKQFNKQHMGKGKRNKDSKKSAKKKTTSSKDQKPNTRRHSIKPTYVQGMKMKKRSASKNQIIHLNKLSMQDIKKLNLSFMNKEPEYNNPVAEDTDKVKGTDISHIGWNFREDTASLRLDDVNN